MICTFFGDKILPCRDTQKGRFSPYFPLQDSPFLSLLEETSSYLIFFITFFIDHLAKNLSYAP